MRISDWSSDVCSSDLLAMIVGGHVLWLLGLSMAAANVAGNQLGARLAIRFGGRGVRPLLVVMSFALTAKLLADPANPLCTFFFVSAGGGAARAMRAACLSTFSTAPSPLASASLWTQPIF